MALYNEAIIIYVIRHDVLHGNQYWLSGDVWGLVYNIISPDNANYSYMYKSPSGKITLFNTFTP